jgi:hypothetical protein
MLREKPWPWLAVSGWDMGLLLPKRDPKQNVESWLRKELLEKLMAFVLGGHSI